MKKLASIVVIVTVLLIMSTCLVACLGASTNSADYKSRLENKGYTVTNIDVSLVERDMEWGLYAANADNMVTVALFKNENDAKAAEQESKDMPNTSVYRSGKLVIAGTEQGVKDARG